VPVRRRRGEPTAARHEAENSVAPSADFAGRLVAVIDDDRVVVDAMCTLFASWGCRVAGGDDALALLATIGKESPNLIVADLRLANGRSGIAAIADLRRAFAHAIPALIVSGDTTDAAREETRAAGITMLAKPVVAGALRAAAEAIVAAAAPRMSHAKDPSLQEQVSVNL
jgi:DNA-binding NtrC family response regulator